MKTFKKFRQDALNEQYLTLDDCRKAYREGIREGSIGKCPNCGSPNLEKSEQGPQFRECVDCGKTSDQWRITEDEGGSGSAALGGAPTNNIGSGNIAGRDIPLGVRRPEIVGPEPVAPEDFAEKIYRRRPPQ